MTTKLDSLNNDCLIAIFSFLSFRDQMLVAQVCERFRFLIEDMWWQSSTCKKISLSSYFYKSSKVEAYFPKFMHSVSYMVEEIELHTYHIERWGSLFYKNLHFPNINICTATLEPSSLNTDKQLLLITECFPYLTKLTLRGRITGKYIWKLKDLNELHLENFDTNFKSANICRIYKNLHLKKITLFNEENKTSVGFSKALCLLYHCRTLEELQIAGDIVHLTIADIKKVKNLRKITAGMLLSFRFIPYPLEDIGAHFGSKIESVIFNHVIRDRADYLKGIDKMINLRQMIFFDDSITSEQLRYLSEVLCKTLEEFYYLKSSRKTEDIEKFLLLVSNCTRLKLLDVSSTSIDLTLIRRVSNLLDKKERQKPLLLRCWDTKISKNDLQNLYLSKNLEISFEKKDVQLPDEYFFQVILKNDK